MPSSDEASPFLRNMREVIRVRHYSIRTEETYVQWVKRFIVFHGKRHPSQMGEAEVAAFLTISQRWETSPPPLSSGVQRVSVSLRQCPEPPFRTNFGVDQLWCRACILYYPQPTTLLAQSPQ